MDLASCALDNRFTAQQIDAMRASIRGELLSGSKYLQIGNFQQIHPDDVKLAFDLYDEIFFDGLCRKTVAQWPLGFRVSTRMTSAGGKTTRRERRRQSGNTERRNRQRQGRHRSEPHRLG